MVAASRPSNISQGRVVQINRANIIKTRKTRDLIPRVRRAKFNLPFSSVGTVVVKAINITNVQRVKLQQNIERIKNEIKIQRERTFTGSRDRRNRAKDKIDGLQVELREASKLLLFIPKNSGLVFSDINSNIRMAKQSGTAQYKFERDKREEMDKLVRKATVTVNGKSTKIVVRRVPRTRVSQKVGTTRTSKVTVKGETSTVSVKRVR